MQISAARSITWEAAPTNLSRRRRLDERRNDGLLGSHLELLVDWRLLCRLGVKHFAVAPLVADVEVGGASIDGLRQPRYRLAFYE